MTLLRGNLSQQRLTSSHSSCLQSHPRLIPCGRSVPAVHGVRGERNIVSQASSFWLDEALPVPASSTATIGPNVAEQFTSSPQRANSDASCTEEASTSDTAAGYSEHFWPWKYGSRIRYLCAGSSGPPLLLIHGFGVGSFHFDNNLRTLGRTHRVWAVDLLGQGESWPEALSLDERLFFSTQTWCDQLTDFIATFIKEPPYLVGNSLGGYLAVRLASQKPDLVRGLVLLNATPFWSVRPPSAPSGLWKLMDSWYDGAAPAPKVVIDLVERLGWHQLRHPDNIRQLIRQVYISQTAADEALVQRIATAANHPAAVHAFTSIMMSPGGGVSFAFMLQALQDVGLPVCLAYGREDPWVKPIWGQRIKRQLPSATYLEVSPAGHCPHHECPVALNTAIAAWVSAVEAGQALPLATGQSWSLTEADGRQVAVTHVDGSPRTPLERLDAAWAVWFGRKGDPIKPQAPIQP